MSQSHPPPHTPPSVRLAASLGRAAILVGLRDQELGIQRALSSSYGSSDAPLPIKEATNGVNLVNVLSSRLAHLDTEHPAASTAPSTGSLDSAQRATGDAALDLLIVIHLGLQHKKRDPSTRVATQTPPSHKHHHYQQPSRNGNSFSTTSTPAGEEDVGLGVKDRKLAGILLSLAARWALQTRLQAYDTALAALSPGLYPRRRTGGRDANTAPTTVSQSSRFEEIVEEDDAARMAKAQSFSTAHRDLAEVVARWTSMLVIQRPTAAQSRSKPIPASTTDTFDSSTDISNLLLQTNTVELAAALLRLARGPRPSIAGPGADTAQPDASAHISSLLRFLSTASAISTLSSVLSAPPTLALVGLPIFVRSAASRLISAQLLRPDGVRAILIATLGGVDAENEDDGAKNTLQKYEHLARLLGTAPQGLDTSSYLSMILPRLLDIIDPDPEKTIAAPSPNHMRAAAFTLTRISEKHPSDFDRAVQARIYVRFSAGPPPFTSTSAHADDAITVVSASSFARAVTALSSLLLFAEPSPVFIDRLLIPVAPQLLSLACFLHKTAGRNAKSKVGQVGDGDQVQVLRKQVEGLLQAWTRLVDAAEGGRTLAAAIRRAESGIGSGAPADGGGKGGEDGEKTLYWAEEAEGVAICYGQPPQQPSDSSNLLGTLSLTDLAQALSGGGSDSNSDALPNLPLSLTSSLRLTPDPKLIIDLLHRSKRKDLAKSLLPHILDTYMGQKLARKAGNAGRQARGAALETRSILYLQLILQLFETFGSGLLEGEVGTTLNFINFSLSSPVQRRMESQKEKDKEDGGTEEEMPFISAKNSKTEGASMGSLFDVRGTESAETESQHESKDVEEEEEDAEDDEELVTTSLTLLLSLLEGNPTLSPTTTPLLLVILSKLTPHLDSSDVEIRSLSKEARMVLTARRNASHAIRTTGVSHAPSVDATTEATYREALTLLQDPILPVRAHGLVLLRELVSPDTKTGKRRADLDESLLSSILEIFMQAVQDEESYLYLNAIQGLSAFGTSGGASTISTLVTFYLGLDMHPVPARLTQREVDKCLRLGEALLQVLQKRGETLGPDVEVLVPPLLSSLRDRKVPTTIKTSIISVLGTTVEAIPIALASKGLAREMVDTCLDIVQIETVHRPEAVRSKVRMKVKGETQEVLCSEEEEEEEQGKGKGGGDEEATTLDSSLASLRRAALLLVVVMLRGCKHQLIDHASVENGTGIDALRLPSGSTLPSLSGRIDGGAGTEGRVKVTDLLFPLDLLERTKSVSLYAQARDDDAVVRVQAQDVVQEVAEVEREIVALGLRS